MNIVSIFIMYSVLSGFQSDRWGSSRCPVMASTNFLNVILVCVSTRTI